MNDFLTLGLVNRDAEEALIGSIIIDPEQIDTLDLTKHDFYLTACGEIFESIRVLRHGHREVDYVTIADNLQATGKYVEVGGESYLLKLLTASPNSQNAQSYADIITDLSVRRNGYLKAQQFVRGLCDKGIPPDQTISEFAIQTPKLIRVKGGLEHVSTFASRHYDRIDRMARGEEILTRYPTGILDYDDATLGGLIKKELLILSGKPGMGKTKLMLQMAAGAAKNANVGVYEMETDEDEIMDREISRDAKFPTEHFINANLTEEEWPLYTHSIERYASPNFGFYIDFTPRWSLAALRADLIRAKAQFNLNVFMVDYMKFISDKYGNSETDRLNYISGELKLICRELELAGVVIHAMNKEGAKSTTPDMTSLAQGMDIVYDADKVCLLNEHIPELGNKVDERLRTFVFLKSRRKIKRSFFHLVAIKEYPELGPLQKKANSQAGSLAPNAQSLPHPRNGAAQGGAR